MCPDRTVTVNVPRPDGYGVDVVPLSVAVSRISQQTYLARSEQQPPGALDGHRWRISPTAVGIPI